MATMQYADLVADATKQNLDARSHGVNFFVTVHS
jgi:hypothetical protein